MAFYQLQDIYNDLDVICADASTGLFPRNSSVTFVNEAIRKAKRLPGGAEFPSREFTAQIALMSGITRYAAPTGMDDMIGIFDQVTVPDRLNFSRRDASVFRRDFPGNENIFAIDRIKTSRVLLANLVTIQLSTPQIDNTASLTGNGTWAAVSGTDAANLGTDTIHFPGNLTGIKFDIDVSLSGTDTAAVEKTDLTTVDLSGDAVRRAGMATMLFFWPSTTMPTSVTYRFGTNSSNYYEITVTTQIDGTPFVQGLNELGFDWLNVTPTGSPTDSTINYERFLVTFPSTITSDVLGVAFSNIVMREKMFADCRFLSKYLVLDDDGVTLKEAFDDQDDTDSTLLIDEEYVDWFVHHTAKRLFAFYEVDQDKRDVMEESTEEIEEGMALRSPGRRAPPQGTWQDTDDFNAYMN